MRNYLIVVLVNISLSSVWCTSVLDTSNIPHSRQRRYVTFPEGSSFQLVYCLTIPLIIPNSIFTFGWTAGVAWQLPNDTRAFHYPTDKRENHLHRRHRRELLPKIEAFLGSRGFNGRQCVKRAICEAAKRAKNNQKSKPNHFIYEVVHAIFSFPVQDDESENDEIISEYLQAHNANIDDCTLAFPLCPGSLFDFVFKPFKRL